MAIIDNSGIIISTDYQFAKLIDRSITEAIIPTNIARIAGSVFTNLTSLIKVYIPKNIKTIDAGAFGGCSSLQKVEFEDNGVNTISQTAFQKCTSLEEIKLPNSLTALYGQAFGNCSALKKASIGESLSVLGNTSPFWTCSSLAYVFFRGDTIIRYSSTVGMFVGCGNMRLFDMRYMLSAKDKASSNDLTSDTVYLYINVPDSLYSQFTALPNWSALNLKRWVHSCDVASFEEIQNPIDGDYYSLKGDTNYLNPLGEKQIDIRQYVSGQWIEVDIG